MSWYSTPIQPIDPVVVSQQPKPAIRYLRDNFMGTGQNSYVQPPAQDQSMWQALKNVQPITQGILNQRWGYANFAGLINPANRLYNFQSDSLGTRAIVATGPAGVTAFSENGQTYLANIFIPESPASVLRSVTSRNYQYFCDGYNAIDAAHRSGDSLKWNGAIANGVTNIGIAANDVTMNAAGGGTSGNTAGPLTGSSAVDQSDNANPWTNPAGVIANNPVSPASATGSETVTITTSRLGIQTITYSNIKTKMDSIKVLGFNFTSVPSAITGIQVAVTYKASNTGGGVLFNRSAAVVATLIKNNVTTGVSRSFTPVMGGGFATTALGSSTDLWGSSFASADVLNPNFGLSITANAILQLNTDSPSDGVYNPAVTVFIDYVVITLFFGGITGGSTSSGSGVGVLSAVGGGAVNLTIGRIYYLVGNSSATGHFSDLSPPSLTTGGSANAEFNLLLATYNDPQVDTKYVLATADGGDPSILYEASVLIPGLTISSWVIDGSNHVTFTGVYTGPQFVPGMTVVIGGLAHGSYMNGATLTVAGGIDSPTSTTFQSSFTHGADSATEIGIAGNTSFAIPNGIKYVVDNTPDPNLVLNQPLLYTDQFGNEFGLTLNTPPPAGNLLLKHQGRLWMAGVPGATHSVYFSKSVSELTLPNGFIAGKYEEAWPLSNYFDVSDGAESVSGLMSDGTTLYIGTQNHIRRFYGNSPANFQEPQIIHPEVGLINQEVAQIVFMQGAPSGAIWMTPDFRVIQSDFSTYVDIGTPIQDILNGLQVSAQTLAHAAFVADGEFDLYILAVPYNQSTYCDLHLVFDLRNRQWYVWQPANGSLALLYNIAQNGATQWLFLDGTGQNLNLYSSAATTDNGVTIPVTATTTWLHLGEATRRKILNEIQVYGNTGLTMNVYGANNFADFASPHSVVYNRNLRKSPFGTWNLYLTGDKTRYRYYQFSFNSTNGQIPLLGSFAIASTALDDL